MDAPDISFLIVPTELGFMVIACWWGVDHMFGVPGEPTQLQTLVGTYETLAEAEQHRDAYVHAPPIMSTRLDMDMNGHGHHG